MIHLACDHLVVVSRAVLVLGCEAVRNAAMALMMLEFSKGLSQEKAVQDELLPNAETKLGQGAIGLS